MSARYWEDVAIGGRYVLGQYIFSEDAIMDFARKYDPQPFHIDREAAAKSAFGGIIASGWHTAAVFMKLSAAAREREDGTSQLLRVGISPGFEHLEWLKPVRPGMTLTYSSEVIEKVALRSRPEWGLIKTSNQAHNSHGTLMMRFTGKGFVERRPR